MLKNKFNVGDYVAVDKPLRIYKIADRDTTRYFATYVGPDQQTIDNALVFINYDSINVRLATKAEIVLYSKSGSNCGTIIVPFQTFLTNRG